MSGDFEKILYSDEGGGLKYYKQMSRELGLEQLSILKKIIFFAEIKEISY